MQQCTMAEWSSMSIVTTSVTIDIGAQRWSISWPSLGLILAILGLILDERSFYSVAVSCICIYMYMFVIVGHTGFEEPQHWRSWQVVTPFDTTS